MHRDRKTLLVPFLLLANALGAGCGLSDDREDPGDFDVVLTQPAEGFSFGSQTTYAIVKAVPVITDPATVIPPVVGPSPSVPNPITTPNPDPSASPAPAPSPNPGIGATSVLSDTIINTIVKNLDARGYQKIDDPSGATKPNLFIEAGVMETTQTQIYYDYWYPYYGAYYAPYYGFSAGYATTAVPYVVTSNYGSVFVIATDPSRADPVTQKIPVVWTAIVNGPSDGATGPDDQARVENGLNQAFSQSPYFRREQ